jgi:HEPN domain-containing protein
MAQNRGYDWFRQSREDLLWTQDTLKAGRYAQACFAAQQVGEKTIKAIAFKRNNTEVRSHSILEIARALKLDGEIESIAKRLDQYYISSRYPDAFPSGAPFDFFTRDQAEEALRFARRMVEIVSESFREEIESELGKSASSGSASESPSEDTAVKGNGKEHDGAGDPGKE